MTDLKRRIQRVASSMNARARKYHAPGVITWQQLAIKGDICEYCGVQMLLDDGTWDHKIALDKGGTNWPENVVRCCTTCQRQKFTKSPDQYEEYNLLWARCPVDATVYKPRWAEWINGRARFCSLSCAGKSGRGEYGPTLLVEGPEGRNVLGVAEPARPQRLRSGDAQREDVPSASGQSLAGGRTVR